MAKITFPDGSVRGPAKLDIVQIAALLEWLPADEKGLDGDIERYAHQRNVYRRVAKRAQRRLGVRRLAKLP